MVAPLGSVDFVFIDCRRNPYRVRTWSNGQIWLHYWSEGSKSWVTLRTVSADEAETLSEHKLPPEVAKHYEAELPFPIIPPNAKRSQPAKETNEV